MGIVAPEYTVNVTGTIKDIMQRSAKPIQAKQPLFLLGGSYINQTPHSSAYKRRLKSLLEKNLA